jgi:hypothetical protein
VYLDEKVDNLDYLTLSIVYDPENISFDVDDIDTQTDYKILSNEGGARMKDKVHTQNIFQSADAELLKKAVTAKIEKLVNSQVKKAD